MKCTNCGTEYDPSAPGGCPECAKTQAAPNQRPGCMVIAMGLVPLAILLLVFLVVLLRAAASATFAH
jgi:hypothetical protein